MPDTLENKYLSDSHDLLSLPPGQSGLVEWKCPSNIALIKYWGKKPVQRPLNPSLSFSLMNSVTTMTVDYQTIKEQRQLSLEFLMENKPNQAFAERVFHYLNHISQYLPFLRSLHLRIQSQNSFPHSAGIASSASSYGALALALCSIEQLLFGTLENEDEFFQKSSFLARLGSGSACRSVYGGWTIWGYTPTIHGSSDEAAISMTRSIHPVFKDYCDSVLVVSSGQKSVTSSIGHALMEQHPFASGRISQANYNLEKLIQALVRGDENRFIDIIENEALTLHGLMLSSNPGFVLLQPNTIEIINKIIVFRKNTGLSVSFTLDAGANVHVLYPAAIENEIRLFIEKDLRKYCENDWIIHDRVGSGPVKSEQL